MIDLSDIHVLLILSHTVVGFATLVAFWVPLFARKGGSLHRGFGKFFYYCGCYVAITAILSSLWAMLAPESFYTSSALADFESGEMQFLFATLLVLGLVIFTGLRLGVRLVRNKNTPEKLGTRVEKTLRALCGLAGLWLLCYGVWQYRSTGGQGGYILCMVVGGIGVLTTPRELKFLANPSPAPRQWLYKHIETMIGCGIGFHVAFLLFGVRRLVVMQWMNGPWSIAVVLSPFAIGYLAIYLWIRHYKTKYRDE